MKNIVLFASGSGTNAANICSFFSEHSEINVSALFCNKADAFVIHRMKEYNVPCIVFNKGQFNDSDYFLSIIEKYSPDLIILAGFLWLIPSYLIQRYPNKIINIHPSLLPKFGGKGMHGMHVHEAVYEAKEKQTGITIHFVNEAYDEGAIIYQAKTELSSFDTPDIIAQKIHVLEMENFPRIIEKVLEGNV